MSPSDEECVRLCLNQHPEIFRLLVERYQSPLSKYLYRRLGSLDKATEAAQEAFVRAFFSLSKLKKPQLFFSWLLGIGERVALETLRTARRRRAVNRERVGSAHLAGKHDPDEDTPVREAVDRLPESYRELIVRRFYAGQSCAEISADLGVPLGTVTKRLSLAYSLLRQSLREQTPHQEQELPG
jgi:RNA polymerase sigma-70 factor (ECF subfamily)